MSTNSDSMIAEEQVIANQVEQAKALLFKAQFVESDKVTDAVLAAAPNHVPALYVQAISKRYQQSFSEALALLEKIYTLAPDHARAYQELGHLQVARASQSNAIAAYEQAVRINPALVASWKALVVLYRQKGEHQACDFAQQQVEYLEKLPRELQAVKSYICEGRIDEADEICRRFLRSNKQHVEGIRLLAEIADHLKVLDDAEFLLESAVEFEPEHVYARVDYINILNKRQKFGQALNIARQLVSEFPKSTHFKALLASTSVGVGRTAEAIDLFEQVIKESPAQEETILSLGHAYKTFGNIEKSVQAYRQAYSIKPDFGDAFWSLANTKTYTFTDEEIAHMLEYERNESTSVVDRVHFCFALGKSFEDNKDYARSFEFYERGNALNKKHLNYDAPLITERVSRQIDVCTAELFEKNQDVGCPDPAPIFIVGLPRAGSTLLEQILASHSQVDGTMELSNILTLAYKLRGRKKTRAGEEPKYPRVLEELKAEHFERFGQEFIEDTMVYRQGSPYFIDKMPNNFLHLGLIKLMLPNAKVIDARRHPMSCCFGGFKQLFAEGQEFTYGLKEIGTYYREYVRLMDHWDKVLPGFVLRVQHEDVVENLEEQVRRILDFCGLPFEESCVNYHETERSIRTPSAEQVRQPIYKTGLEQWRNYEAWLDPLKDALGTEILARYPIP